MALLALALSLGAAALPTRATAASLGRELGYLASAQNADGGFGAGSGQSSSELYTGWAAMGLAAAGRNPATLKRGGRSVLDSLRGEAATLQSLGDIERTVLAARACGASAYSFAGRNLVAEVLRARGHDNSFDEQVNLTAFAIFSLRAVGHSASFAPIREAAGWIERQQNGDGGFGFGGRGSRSDVDDTGRGAAGARRSGRSQQAHPRPRDGVSDPLARRRRGLPAAVRQRIERAVDGVGRTGPDRGWQEPEHGPPCRQPYADGLSRKPARAERQRALLAHERADAGMGHRAGVDCAGGQDVPGRRLTESQTQRRAASAPL